MAVVSVALRKESVDRNPYIPLAKVRHCESLSARRAWIEISEYRSNSICLCVALRKESVDRNMNIKANPSIMYASLSARRAWIEIGSNESSEDANNGRSPQGERG